MALIMRVIINFITIPYNAYLFLNAMCKSIYRMNFSHMNLLNWITAEDAANTVVNGLGKILEDSAKYDCLAFSLKQTYYGG